MKLSKFKLLLRTERETKSSNVFPICLRISKFRKSMYRTISHVEPIYWDEKNQCIKNKHPNVVQLKALIEKKVSEIRNVVASMELKDPSITIDDIRRRLDNLDNIIPFSLDFFEYAQNDLEKIEEKGGSHATYKKYKTVIKKLKEFTKKDNLPIKNITLDFVKQFERYLLEIKKNNRNTTTVNLKAFARLMNDIYNNSNYNLDRNKNPFLNKKELKMKREETERVYLEIGELKQIEKLRYSDKLYYVRDIFLIECYSGLRISDILTLKWKNYDGERIVTETRKNKKKLDIPAHDKIKEIFSLRQLNIENGGIRIKPNDYIFDLLKVDIERASKKDVLNAIGSPTAIINKNLKELAKKAKIQKNLSTHVGRHTFATLLVTKNINPFVMKELLGHSDIRVTQIYAKVINPEKVKAIGALNNL